MTWGAVAIGGATLVSAGLSYSAAKSASGDASDASAAALAFEQERYADFKETYGGIEENLSDYYSSLTPEYYEARGLEVFQQEHQLALDNVRSTLAQRGIEDSGIAAATEVAFAQEGAIKRADIRTSAPSIAAEEKRGFLQVGLGQDPGASYSRTLSDRATQAGAASRDASAAAGRATGTAITAVGTGLSDYLNRPVPPTPVQVGPGSTGLGKYGVE